MHKDLHITDTFSRLRVWRRTHATDKAFAMFTMALVLSSTACQSAGTPPQSSSGIHPQSGDILCAPSVCPTPTPNSSLLTLSGQDSGVNGGSPATATFTWDGSINDAASGSTYDSSGKWLLRGTAGIAFANSNITATLTTQPNGGSQTTVTFTLPGAPVTGQVYTIAPGVTARYNSDGTGTFWYTRNGVNYKEKVTPSGSDYTITTTGSDSSQASTSVSPLIAVGPSPAPTASPTPAPNCKGMQLWVDRIFIIGGAAALIPGVEPLGGGILLWGAFLQYETNEACL